MALADNRAKIQALIAGINALPDAGRTVVRDGIAYAEATDPIDSGRVYTEGEPLEDGDMTEIEAKAKAFDILAGVSE